MTWQTISGIIAIAGFACAAIGFFFKKILPAIRTGSRIADKFTGVPANPKTGQEAEPGLFEVLTHQNEILAAQNRVMASLTAEVEKVKQQVQNSHDTNLRDDVDEVIGKVDSLHDKLDDHLKGCPGGPTTTINVNGGTQ